MYAVYTPGHVDTDTEWFFIRSENVNTAKLQVFPMTAFWRSIDQYGIHTDHIYR